MSDEKKHVYKVEIEAPAEKVWDAIINPDQQKLYQQMSARGELKVGEPYDLVDEQGNVLIKGEILEVDPPRRFVTTSSHQWSDEVRSEPPSRVTREVEQKGSMCLVTVTHDQLENSPETYKQVAGGWPSIVAGLKSFVETGQPVAPRWQQHAEGN